MYTDTRSQLDQLIRSEIDWNGRSTLADGLNTEIHQIRSRHNIAEWNSYPSQHCVNTMIALGWDRTT